MSREIYESAEDRAAEAEIADALGNRWGCSMVKLPPRYPVDFAAVKDGRIRGWIEIKKRNISMGQYTSIILSLKKLIEAQGLAHCTRIPAIFCVGTDDGIFYAEITTISPDESSM